MADNYDAMFEAAGQAYNVDPQLLKTIWAIESGAKSVASRGAAGETGPMQFMPKTAGQYNIDPTDMTQAIPAAAKIIRHGLDLYGDPAAALRVYNGGDNGPNNPATIPYVMKAQALYPKMITSKQSATTNDSVDLGDQIINGKIPSGNAPTSDPSFDLGDSIINQSKSAPAGTANRTETLAKPSSDQSVIPNSVNIPQPVQNFVAGSVRGARDVADVAAPWLAAGVNKLSHLQGVAEIDKAFPLLGRLDQTYSQDPTAALTADRKAYDQQYGNSLAAGLGRLTGNIATTLPVTGGIGSAGEALIGRVANPLVQSGINLGSSALQGGAGALMTGGNPLYGAAAGGALGAAGQVAGGASNLLQPGGMVSNVLHSRIADRVVQALGGLGGFHVGDIPGMMIGYAVGPIIKDISERYGFKTASFVSELLNKANTAGITTGGAGIGAGSLKSINNDANRLQSAQ